MSYGNLSQTRTEKKELKGKLFFICWQSLTKKSPPCTIAPKIYVQGHRTIQPQWNYAFKRSENHEPDICLSVVTVFSKRPWWLMSIKIKIHEYVFLQVVPLTAQSNILTTISAPTSRDTKHSRESVSLRWISLKNSQKRTFPVQGCS